MLYVKCPLTHVKFFITSWIRIVNFPSLERMTIKGIHVNQYGQSMAIRFNTGKKTTLISDGKRESLKNFRCDETRCSHYIRWESLRNYEAIDVDYSRAATQRIDEDISI